MKSKVLVVEDYEDTREFMKFLLQDYGFDVSEAANGFVANLRQTPAGSFSIQLLVACSSDTVEKALASVAAPDLYILPVNYKGRPCYRVCWGVYESEMRADSAVRTLPEYFRKGGASPRVVPTSGLLP